MRKAQITIFILLAVLIIFVAGIFLWSLRNQRLDLSPISKSIQLQNQADIVKSYIEQCLFDVSVKGIYLLGSQGGYIDPEYNAFYGDYDQVEWKRSGNLKIPYWYYNGIDISPSLEQLETKLGRYILVEAENCTKVEKFPSLAGIEVLKPETTYQETYFDFSQEKTHIQVSINDKDVSVKYFFPITLKQGNSQILIENYYAEVPIALGEDFGIAKEIVGKIGTAEKEGYNLEPDCTNYNREGYTNIFPFNNMILLIDYEPYFNPEFERSFKLQYLYSGKIVYGYCSG